MTNPLHVIEDAAKAANIRVDDILTVNRTSHDMAYPARALAMNAAHLGGMSKDAIADAFHREPTTVGHAIRRAGQMLEKGDGYVTRIHAAAMRRIVPAQMTDENWTDFNPFSPKLRGAG